MQIKTTTIPFDASSKCVKKVYCMQPIPFSTKLPYNEVERESEGVNRDNVLFYTVTPNSNVLFIFECVETI